MALLPFFSVWVLTVREQWDGGKVTCEIEHLNEIETTISLPFFNKFECYDGIIMFSFKNSSLYHICNVLGTKVP